MPFTFSPTQNADVLDARARFANSETERFGNNGVALPRDAWKAMDREPVELLRQSYRILSDMSAISTPVNIGKSLHEFMRISDSGEAQVSMDGTPQITSDAAAVSYGATPLPVITAGFSVPWRQLEAAKSDGWDMIAPNRANVLDKVANTAESLILDGASSAVVNGGALYGLRTHPSRLTRSTAVTLNGATGPQWMDEIKAMREALLAKDMEEAVTLYVNPSDWLYAQTARFESGYNAGTIAQAILAMEGVVTAVVPSKRIAANEVLAVVKDKRFIRLLSGMPLTLYPRQRLDSRDPLQFVVMQAVAPEIRDDYAGAAGIVHSA